MGSDLHLFREGIKPAWEDPNNCKGGHWTIRLKKGLTSHYWEELLFAIIGEMFDVGNEICGLSCCIRHGEDVVSVWNRSADRRDVCDKINEVAISLYYKSNRAMKPITNVCDVFGLGHT